MNNSLHDESWDYALRVCKHMKRFWALHPGQKGVGNGKGFVQREPWNKGKPGYEVLGLKDSPERKRWLNSYNQRILRHQKAQEEALHRQHTQPVDAGSLDGTVPGAECGWLTGSRDPLAGGG